MVPKNLSWSESTQYLLRSGSAYHARGHTHLASLCKWPQRYTSIGQHGSKRLNLEWIGLVVTEFRPPQGSKSALGVNPPSGFWVLEPTRPQERLSRPWTRPCGHNEQIIVALHIYRPRRFQWISFGVNRPSGYWVKASAKFGPARKHCLINVVVSGIVALYV